jgi:hypothetical protein
MGGVYVQDALNLRRSAHCLPLSRPLPVVSTFSQRSQAISEKSQSLCTDCEESADRQRRGGRPPERAFQVFRTLILNYFPDAEDAILRLTRSQRRRLCGTRRNVGDQAVAVGSGLNEPLPEHPAGAG